MGNTITLGINVKYWKLLRDVSNSVLKDSRELQLDMYPPQNRGPYILEHPNFMNQMIRTGIIRKALVFYYFLPETTPSPRQKTSHYNLSKMLVKLLKMDLLAKEESVLSCYLPKNIAILTLYGWGLRWSNVFLSYIIQY